MLTLNLIPPGLKHDEETASMLHRWLAAVILLTVIVLIGTAGIIGTWIMLKNHATTINSELKTLQQKQSATSSKDITGTTSALNATIKTMTTALGTPRSWANDSATVLANLTPALTVTELTILPSGQFHLVGLADSRQSFVKLDQDLKANPKLSKVATTSAASKRTAVPFDFTGIVNAPTP